MIFDRDLLELKPIIDFFGHILGDSAEIVIHDLNKKGETIIAIFNGELTKRKVGDTISEFTLDILTNKVKNENDFDGYKANVVALKKGYISHDLLIFNSSGEVKGLICVNLYAQNLEPALKLLNALVGNYSGDANKEKIIKPDYSQVSKKISDANSFMELSESIIDNIISESGLNPRDMTHEDRINIIKKIKEKGIFQLKGVVSLVAKKIYISEPTIYRYLGNS